MADDPKDTIRKLIPYLQSITKARTVDEAQREARLALRMIEADGHMKRGK